MTDIARFAKLPKWARDLIERQSSRIRYLEGEINKRDTGEGNSWNNAHVEETGDVRHTRYKPSPFHAVQFHLSPPGSERDWFQCRNVPMNSTLDGPGYTGPRALEIMGYDSALVIPRCSNVVWIINTQK
jgi:hypothetical protein